MNKKNSRNNVESSESNSIHWLENSLKKSSGNMEDVFDVIPRGIAKEAREFHRQIPGYRQTPLKGLNNLARMLNLGGIWVKDESQRLNLNSFKALGGAFAIYSYLKNKLDPDREKMSFEELRADAVNGNISNTVFATATDGNHGRGVAWAANKLGYKSIIYVHENTSQPRIDAIESYGAKVRIIKGTYDDAVEQLSRDAESNGWQIISDTSWPGYEVIPAWIMQGYTTMLAEVQEQFAGMGLGQPTHVFVQAGVGSLAASVLGFYQGLMEENRPRTVVVEPSKAACIFESAKEKKKVKFEGELDTIMAGLACGDPNPMAWEVLKKCTDFFMACPDFVAAKGMRMYAVPLEGDPFVVSGESGAVTLGALTLIMEQESLSSLRQKLDLGPDSQVLLLNTEGNTDPEYFRRVVWEGTHPLPKKFKIAEK
ncbi:MAG: diaminopropionate ammonia-lyase [Elusimicrobiota bacterium]